MKLFEVKAGEKVRIIHKFSNSLMAKYSFDVAPLKEGEEVLGTVEVKGSNWLLPKEAKIQKLTAKNQVEKSAWDSFYSVYIVPDVDVKVSIDKADYTKMWPLLVFALLVTGIALAIMFSTGS